MDTPMASALWHFQNKHAGIDQTWRPSAATLFVVRENRLPSTPDPVGLWTPSSSPYRHSSHVPTTPLLRFASVARSRKVTYDLLIPRPKGGYKTVRVLTDATSEQLGDFIQNEAEKLGTSSPDIDQAVEYFLTSPTAYLAKEGLHDHLEKDKITYEPNKKSASSQETAKSDCILPESIPLPASPTVDTLDRSGLPTIFEDNTFADLYALPIRLPGTYPPPSEHDAEDQKIAADFCYALADPPIRFSVMMLQGMDHMLRHLVETQMRRLYGNGGAHTVRRASTQLGESGRRRSVAVNR